MPWRFTAETAQVRRTGENGDRLLSRDERSDRTIVATAAYNVTPDQAGLFPEVSCFCFSEQTLGPARRAEWPVVFSSIRARKDPSMANVEQLTLSYTFFETKKTRALKTGTSRNPG